jgi:S-formylglutathione hydrolase FrmB
MGGKEDIAYKNCQIMLSKFDEMKIKYIYYEHPGGHTWPVWRNDLYDLAPLPKIRLYFWKMFLRLATDPTLALPF